MRKMLAACSLVPCSFATAAEPALPDLLTGAFPRTRVLVLGSFHFDDAGLDGYKPTHHFDPLSEEGRRAVDGLLDRLACFAPTHIALEARRDRQAKLDDRYARFRRGELDDSRNEIDRVGLALAARLDHAAVHAVDAPAPELHPGFDDNGFDALVDGWGQRAWRESPWHERFAALYAHDDAKKLEVPLLDTLVYMNSPERLRIGHGHYLIGSIRVGSGDRQGYLGADFATQWYARNLRIFANLARLTQDPEYRILLLIGAGHVPVIKHALEASPEYAYVSPADVLGGSGACAPAAAGRDDAG
jgi:hypothetical protein